MADAAAANLTTHSSDKHEPLDNNSHRHEEADGGGDVAPPIEQLFRKRKASKASLRRTASSSSAASLEEPADSGAGEPEDELDLQYVALLRLHSFGGVVAIWRSLIARGREILAGTRALQRTRTKRPGVTTVATRSSATSLGPTPDNEKSIGATLSGTFTQQTGVQEVNVQMCVCVCGAGVLLMCMRIYRALDRGGIREEYIKQRMKDVLPELQEEDDADTTSSSSATKAAALTPDDALYQIPEHLKLATKPPNDEDESSASSVGQLLNGVVEIELPIEYKQKNIEETEKARREFLASRKNRGSASSSAGGQHFPRHFGSGGGGGGGGGEQRRDYKRRRDEDSATDEMVYERFKKRYRF